MRTTPNKRDFLKIKESEIQKQIVEYLNYRKDVYFTRNNSFAGKIMRGNGSVGYIKNNKPGAPDIIILFKGRYIGAEIKNKTGHQAEVQKQAEADIRRNGGEYYIVRSLEEIREILK